MKLITPSFSSGLLIIIYNMDWTFRKGLESGAKEGGIEWEMLKFGQGQPGKMKLQVIIGTGKGARVGIEIGVGGEGHQEVKFQGVMEDGVVSKEIFDNVEEAHNGDGNAQFFLHFAYKAF